MKYLGLLRGINVGGNNKIAMSSLRECFKAMGFTDVSTYINSGNIFFSSDDTDIARLVKKCESAIEKQFGFSVIVMVITVDMLQEAVDHAPTWWGTKDRKEIRSDTLFIIPPIAPNDVMTHLKMKSSAVDKFKIYGQVIFWSLPMEEYGKSVMPKIIGTPIYRSITIRSSVTTKKLLEIAKSL